MILRTDKLDLEKKNKRLLTIKVDEQFTRKHNRGEDFKSSRSQSWGTDGLRKCPNL